MRTSRLAKNRIWMRSITFIVITSFLCQNVVWANKQKDKECLAPRSIFKLFKGKGRTLAHALDTEDRLLALRDEIFSGKTDEKVLRNIDESRANKRYIHEIKLSCKIEQVEGYNNVYLMKGNNLYKDKYGTEQAILFYPKDEVPLELLRNEYGLKTEEDEEYAKRGFWIASAYNLLPVVGHTFDFDKMVERAEVLGISLPILKTTAVNLITGDAEEIVIRPYKISDYDACGGIGSGTDLGLLRTAGINNRCGLLLLAESRRGIEGIAYFVVESKATTLDRIFKEYLGERPEEVLVLKLLAVKPNNIFCSSGRVFRGIGKLLIASVIQTGIQSEAISNGQKGNLLVLGADRMSSSINDPKGFYKTIGMEQIGKTNNFYFPPNKGRVFLDKVLGGIVKNRNSAQPPAAGVSETEPSLVPPEEKPQKENKRGVEPFLSTPLISTSYKIQEKIINVSKVLAIWVASGLLIYFIYPYYINFKIAHSIIAPTLIYPIFVSLGVLLGEAFDIHIKKVKSKYDWQTIQRWLLVGMVGGFVNGYLWYYIGLETHFGNYSLFMKILLERMYYTFFGIPFKILLAILFVNYSKQDKRNWIDIWNQFKPKVFSVSIIGLIYWISANIFTFGFFAKEYWFLITNILALPWDGFLSRIIKKEGKKKGDSAQLPTTTPAEKTEPSPVFLLRFYQIIKEFYNFLKNKILTREHLRQAFNLNPKGLSLKGIINVIIVNLNSLFKEMRIKNSTLAFFILSAVVVASNLLIVHLLLLVPSSSFFLNIFMILGIAILQMPTTSLLKIIAVSFTMTNKDLSKEKSLVEAVEKNINNLKRICKLFIRVGIIIPIYEEFLFRLLMVNVIQILFGPIVAILISSILFSMCHLLLSSKEQVFYSFYSSILLGTTYVLGGSILFPIIMHMVINSIPIVVVSLLTFLKFDENGDVLADKLNRDGAQLPSASSEPKPSPLPDKGTPATLLKYMFENKIFSDNPKKSVDMAGQRGGKNDSRRTIQRELKVLKAIGLVEGDRVNGYFLPDWLKTIKIEDIIKENSELNLPNPNEKQIRTVVRRINKNRDSAQPSVPDLAKKVAAEGSGAISTAFIKQLSVPEQEKLTPWMKELENLDSVGLDIFKRALKIKGKKIAFDLDETVQVRFRWSPEKEDKRLSSELGDLIYTPWAKPLLIGLLANNELMFITGASKNAARDYIRKIGVFLNKLIETSKIPFYGREDTQGRYESNTDLLDILVKGSGVPQSKLLEQISSLKLPELYGFDFLVDDKDIFQMTYEYPGDAKPITRFLFHRYGDTLIPKWLICVVPYEYNMLDHASYFRGLDIPNNTYLNTGAPKETVDAITMHAASKILDRLEDVRPNPTIMRFLYSDTTPTSTFPRDKLPDVSIEDIKESGKRAAVECVREWLGDLGGELKPGQTAEVLIHYHNEYYFRCPDAMNTIDPLHIGCIFQVTEEDISKSAALPARASESEPSPLSLKEITAGLSGDEKGVIIKNLYSVQIIRKAIDGCFSKERDDLAGELAVSAIDKGIKGITAEDVRKAIDGCFSKGWYNTAGKIAVSAIDKGIEGITAEDVRKAIDECFSKGLYNSVGELAVSAIDKGIKGITAEDVRKAIDGCFSKERYGPAGEIAVNAIDKGIKGITAEDVRKAIDECFSKGEYTEAGKIAISLMDTHYKPILASNPKLKRAEDESFNFLKKNNLLLITSNPFITGKTMNMDSDGFWGVKTLLDNLSDEFKIANGTLDEGRRFDEAVFVNDYIPLAYIMELILPGSIKNMMGLLKDSKKPQVLVRFLDSKKAVLLNEDRTESLVGLVDRIRNAPSHKKQKIDLTGMFKIIDISNGFIEIGSEGILIDELSKFDGTGNIIDLQNNLVMKLLTAIAGSLGIDNVEINVNVYNKLYIPFVNRLIQAMKHIESNEPYKLPRFRGVLNAMFSDRFWDFIENEEQGDETGRDIAKHNKKTRDEIEKLGLNVKEWLGHSEDNRIEQGEFMYYEESSFEYNPVSDTRNVIDYILRVLNIGLDSNQIKDINEYLESIGILPVYDEDRKAVKLSIMEKAKKKKDIIAIFADRSNLSNLLELTERLMLSDNIKNNPNILETVTHMKERINILIERLQQDRYKEELGRMRKYFTVRPIFRNLGHDLFMGDFVTCCLAMNSNEYPDAMVDRLIDEGMNVIEVIDEITGKTMACAWLYITEDGSLVIQNMEINAEYEKIKPLMDKVGEGMIGYAQKFAEYIGARRLLIGMPGHGKYFGEGGFIKERYGNKTIPFGKEKIGGYIGEKYYLDSAGKENAYLVWENKILRSKTTEYFITRGIGCALIPGASSEVFPRRYKSFGEKGETGDSSQLSLDSSETEPFSSPAQKPEDVYIEELLQREEFYTVAGKDYEEISEGISNIMARAIAELIIYSKVKNNNVDKDLVSRLFNHFRSQWLENILQKNEEKGPQFISNLKTAYGDTIFSLHKIFIADDGRIFIYYVDFLHKKEKFLIIENIDPSLNIYWEDVDTTMSRMIGEDKYVIFINLLECIYETIRYELYHAYWDYSRTKSEKTANNYKRWDFLMLKFMTNNAYYRYARKLFKRFKLNKYEEKIHTGKTKNPSLLKWAICSYKMFFEYSRAFRGEKGKALYKMIQNLEEMFDNYRVEFMGKIVSDGDLSQIITQSTNRTTRKTAWLSLMSRGRYMVQGEKRKLEIEGRGYDYEVSLPALMKLRNEVIRKLARYGKKYRNYYEYEIFYDETDADGFFEGEDSYIETILKNIAIPWKEITEELKSELGVEELYPWDFPLFDHSGIIDKIKKYLTPETNKKFLSDIIKAMGLGSLEQLPIVIDDKPRPGKSPWAFCMTLKPGEDIRVLLNEPEDSSPEDLSDRWHELGHAILGVNLDPDTTGIVQNHFISTDEGVAEFMRYIALNKNWLSKYLHIPQHYIKDYIKYMKRLYISKLLETIHLVLFEREAYKNTDQDYNKLWWDIYEKVYQLPRPPEAGEVDGWGFAPHLIMGNYVQYYTYARMIACQLIDCLNTTFPEGLDDPQVGEWLRKNIFSQCNQLHFDTLIKKATGKELNPQYLLKYLLNEKVIDTEPAFSNINSLFRTTAKIFGYSNLNSLFEFMDKQTRDNKPSLLTNTGNNQKYLRRLIKTCISEAPELQEAARKIFLKSINQMSPQLRNYIVTNYFYSKDLKEDKYKDLRLWIMTVFPELVPPNELAFSDAESLIRYTTKFLKGNTSKKMIEDQTIQQLIEFINQKIKNTNTRLVSDTGEGQAYFKSLLRTCASNEPGLQKTAREIFIKLVDHISPQLRYYIFYKYKYFLRGKKYSDLRKWLATVKTRTDPSTLLSSASSETETSTLTITEEPISAIPAGSKIIEKYGKTLCISPKALKKMEKLDKFVAQRDYVAEIAGYGLTKKLNDNTTIVVDFITPRKGKIFDVKDLFLDQFVSGLMRILANSEKLSLSLEDDSIVLISDDERYSATPEDFGWECIREYVEKLSSQKLPFEAEEIKTLLRDHGSISLDTDWDFIVAGRRVWVTDNYMNRVFEEAKRQKASPNFTMHHHPHLGLAIIIFQNKPLNDRQNYYKRLLNFSSGDLAHMKNAEVEWFEIRAMGTPDNLLSETETTSEFYNIEYIDRKITPLKTDINALLGLPQENANPEILSIFIDRLVFFFEELEVEGYNVRIILQYLLGEDKVKELKEKLRLPKDITTLKDFVMQAIFATEEQLESLRLISPDVLNIHARLQTHAIYHEIMQAYERSIELKKKIDIYFTEHKLWHLPLETRIEEIERGVRLCKQFCKENNIIWDNSTTPETGITEREKGSDPFSALPGENPDKIVGFDRNGEGKIVKKHSSSIELQVRRGLDKIQGFPTGLFEGLIESMKSTSTYSVIVPLKKVPVEVSKIQKSSDWDYLPKDLKSLFEQGNILVTTGDISEASEYSLFMYAKDSLVPGGFEGRTGVLLKDGNPVVVTINGKEFIVEIKGVGRPMGGYGPSHMRQTFDEMEITVTGGLEEDPADFEYDLLEQKRVNSSRFNDGVTPRALINLHFKGGECTQGYIMRLSPSSIRVAFTGNEAFHNIDDPEVSEKLSYALADELAESLSEKIPLIHAAPHAENILVINGGRDYVLTDYSDFFSVADSSRDSLEWLKRYFISAGEIINFNPERNFNVFVKQLAKGLRERGKIDADIEENIASAASFEELAEKVWDNYLAYGVYKVRKAFGCKMEMPEGVKSIFNEETLSRISSKVDEYYKDEDVCQKETLNLKVQSMMFNLPIAEDIEASLKWATSPEGFFNVTFPSYLVSVLGFLEREKKLLETVRDMAVRRSNDKLVSEVSTYLNILESRLSEISNQKLKVLFNRVISDPEYLFRLAGLSFKQPENKTVDSPIGTGTTPSELEPSTLATPLVKDHNDYVNKQTALLKDMLSKKKEAILLRIPVDIIKSIGIDNVRDFLEALQMANVYLELYSVSDIQKVDEKKYDLTIKPLPSDFVKRTRENTITLFAASKDEKLTPAIIQNKLGEVGLKLTDTMLVPIGSENDNLGLIRGVIMGLRLLYIARETQERGKVDNSFIEETLSQYKNICKSQGIEEFDLTEQDLIDIATGNSDKIFKVLKKLIKLLPIKPVTGEELKQIYENACQVLTSA